MRLLVVSLVLSLSMLTACSSNEAGSDAPSAVSALDTLPATVEGILTVDVAEGDTDEEGTSEFNFGTLSVGGEDIAVKISGSLLTNAGISEDGGKVKATLGSKSDNYGVTTYTVTSLQRM